MIVIQNKFIFLSNPRTGSRGFTEGLIRAGAVPKDTSHVHTPPNEITLNLPKLTIIRNTYDWAVSYWKAFDKTLTFDQWLEKDLDILGWAENRLNVYDGVANFYMLYEWGHESMFKMLGIDPPLIPLIGASSKVELTQDQRKRIRTKFWRDYEQYEALIKALSPPTFIAPNSNREEIPSLIVSAEGN